MDHLDAQALAARLHAALDSGDLARWGALLDANVRWGGPEETSDTCHTRAEVLNRLAERVAAGLQTEVIEVVPGVESVLVSLRVSRPEADGSRQVRNVYQVMRLRNGLIADIRAYPSREAAAAQAGLESGQAGPDLIARAVIPILNVSDLAASFAWLAKLGFAKKWDWCAADGTPSFGAVASGECEIFVCLNSQGGQGRDGVWLAIWVDQVDAVHDVCVREGLEVIRPPRDEPWGVREMHVRHPDGHVLRISQGVHTH